MPISVPEVVRGDGRLGLTVGTLWIGNLNLLNNIKTKKLFNKWGGSDCFGMLKDWHDGKNNSWAIRFCFSQFLQDKISLFPMTSKVVNDGFDGQGTNCKKWSRFKYDLDEQGKKNFIWPENDEINIQLYKSAMGYHSIIIRIWSKLQYILHQ